MSLSLASSGPAIFPAMSTPTRWFTFPSQRGNLVVSHREFDGERTIYIAGDPAGLRSLGELLIAEADLDQSQFLSSTPMDDFGYHGHLNSGHHIHPQSISVVVARLDSMHTGRFPEGIAPADLPPERPLREGLPSTA